jgi:Ser/Thr protein kinase RdoA (MazF antagonist)
MNKSDPLAVAVEVTASYHVTNPLSEEEVDMIWTMIGARNVQSVANSAHSYKLEPDNEYLLVSAVPAWGLLRQSDAIDVRAANSALRKACAMDTADVAGSL